MWVGRKLLLIVVTSASLLALYGSAVAANQRYRVYLNDRSVEYFERDGLAISEGDIVLGTAHEIAAIRDAPPSSRKALAVVRTDLLWPAGASGIREVPYTHEAGSNVPQAIASFNATFAGVIQWVPRKTQSDYVAFNLTNLANNQSGSCYSALGRVGGRQEIGGNADCLLWQLLHEMGHAIGLYHTHQAKTPQQFVQVSRATIDPVRRYLYDPIFDSIQFDGHDYMSVMHYEYHDSSVTPDFDTMSSIPAGIDLGNHTGYSAADIDAIRRLYNLPARSVVIATNPTGLDVVVDGQRRTAPITLNWELGSAHQIDVPAELQTREGFKFGFGRWSHDGSPTPKSAQLWIVEPEADFAGRATNFPKTGVLTANFVRLLEIQPYLAGGAFGQISVLPEVAPWPGTQSLYPQLTKFTLTANANASYLNYWYWEAANTLTGGAGGTSQASLRVRADAPTQQVGGGFFAAPGIVIQLAGPGVDGSLRSTITFPDNSQKSVALPWAFKTPAGTYKVSVPAILARSESVRFVLQGIDGLDDPANGTIVTPTSGQATKLVTVRMQKQLQPVVQVNPACAGAINLSSPEQWYPIGAVFSASASATGGAIFTGWSGTATGTTPTVSVTANDVPELIASFNSIPEPFALSSLTPAQYTLGQGPTAIAITGTGFTRETYVVINNAITRSPEFVNSHLLRLSLSDGDFPTRSDTSIALGTHVAGNCYGFSNALSVTAVPSNQASKSIVYEFYNASLDHYFITWVADEITKLDNGSLQGWTRTGKSFAVLTASQGSTSAVCRIYIPPGKGDGHYFGRDQTECNGTMAKNPSFVLESPSFFHLYPSSLGTCATGTVPVYRVFSNRADANHRYTTDRAVRDQMVAKGWLAEGDGADAVVMCAPL